MVSLVLVYRICVESIITNISRSEIELREWVLAFRLDILHQRTSETYQRRGSYKAWQKNESDQGDKYGTNTLLYQIAIRII